VQSFAKPQSQDVDNPNFLKAEVLQIVRGKVLNG